MNIKMFATRDFLIPLTDEKGNKYYEYNYSCEFLKICASVYSDQPPFKQLRFESEITTFSNLQKTWDDFYNKVKEKYLEYLEKNGVGLDIFPVPTIKL